MSKKFYEFKQNEDSVDLLIYGDITSWPWSESDVGAYNFAQELAGYSQPLNIHINSMGGEVAEGLAIYNLLKNYGSTVTTICDGMACSAASVIFMAGKNRVMNEGSLLLIHNAWTFAQGDSNALRKAADDMEKITQPSVEIYKAATGLPEETIKSMMDEETWILPNEALEMGFATEIHHDEANQSISDHYLFNAIEKSKKLEAKIAEMEATINNMQKEEEVPDAWTTFFMG